MSDRRSSLILLPCAFALTGLLFDAIGNACQSQQPAPRKTDASDTSCLYDPEVFFISDCIQKAANRELFIKQKVLKQLQFDSYGLAPVFSQTYRWMYVSRTGRVLITGVPIMDNGADIFHDGLVRVVQNGKYGFSNRNGQLVVSPVYDGAMNFENGKAKVCKGCTVKCVAPDCEYSVFSGGEWFQIDTKGAVVSRIPAENEPKLIR
jgi:WG containing repeat